MNRRPKSSQWVTLLAAAALVTAASPAPAVQSDGQTVGPDVFVSTPEIEWGEAQGGRVDYRWTVDVDNPNRRPVAVRVNLRFIDDAGRVLHRDLVSGRVDGDERVTLAQRGTISEQSLDLVAEAEGEPEIRWGDEPYKIRTLYAFATSLRSLEVILVLEDWAGRPLPSAGTVDLYVLEAGSLGARFEGGGMGRDWRQIYARRFDIRPEYFSSRQIGFKALDYEPPALTLGPIHYSVFDDEPRSHEGLVRLVFRTPSGAELVEEDRIYF